MSYLVDTNVISALAPTGRADTRELAGWPEATSASLYLSVVTAMEVQDGIAKASRQGATRKAESLAEWWSVIEHVYGDRIVPVDLKIATRAGRLVDRARGTGSDPGFADALIAATAQVRGLTVLTRNLRHFLPFAMAAVNPFDELPPWPKPTSNQG